MLTVSNLHVHYGRLAAVRGLSMNVVKGEIVCIVGPNGAGKTTTLLAIAGVVTASEGSIEFDGQSITEVPPEFRVQKGISMVPEGRHIFSTLSVEENLRVGSAMRRDKERVAADFRNLLNQFPLFQSRLKSPAGKLSGGEQQQLAIGRALMSRPRLMLIDEPALGLAPRMIEQVYDILLELRRARDATLLLVEQSTERACRIADRIYVMRDGKIQLHGRPAELIADGKIEDAYFGFGPVTEGHVGAVNR